MTINTKKSKKKSDVSTDSNELQTNLELEQNNSEEVSTEKVEVNNVEVVEKNEVVLESKKSFDELDSLPSTQSKTSWIWIRDTNGRPSMSATFASVAFWITTLAYVLSMFESVGPLKFREFNVAACGAYLVPILTLYFSRRWTSDVQSKKNNSCE